MSTADKKPEDVVQVAQPEEKGNIIIRLGNEESVTEGRPIKPMKTRTIGGLISAAVGAVAGWFGAETTLERKLRPFDSEVLKTTTEKLLGRNGVAGAIDESMATAGTSMNALGRGLVSGEIGMNQYMEAVNSGRFKLATFLHDYLGGARGRSNAKIAAAVAGGAVIAGAYTLLAPKDAAEETKTDTPGKDWQVSIADSKEQSPSKAGRGA